MTRENNTQLRPERDGTWPMAGLDHEDVVTTVLHGEPKRSLLNKWLIQAGRRNPALAHLFTEEKLHENLQGLAD